MMEKCTAEKCPVKEALKFLAGAWTVEIYWYLRESPLRFGELQRALAGVSAKVLTERLRDLEDLGVVERRVKETFPPRVEYALTPFGRRFIPILETIAEVGKGIIRKSKRDLTGTTPTQTAVPASAAPVAQQPQNPV